MFDSQRRPVICDFGLSRLTKDSGLGLRMLATGHKFPIRWMAPEVFTESQYDFASDVWSLGVVLWQMLTHQEQPYPEVPEMQHVVFGLQQRRLDLRTSLPSQPQWDTLRGLVCNFRDSSKL